MENSVIEFLRKRDYRLVRELGEGACGKTVLLHDDYIDEDYVCKKYSPYSEAERQELFAGFVREIKLLHRLYHPNVVRVFNYYLYPDQLTGYILMEFVDGTACDEYLTQAPEQVNEVFLQAVNGFGCLETNSILHRDVRPQNLMVTTDGQVKIIDLGFGKWAQKSKDFDKSIELNWWCEIPDEFASDVYDFRTEVYFVGKLFEKVIQEQNIEHFKYTGLLGRMCQRNPASRISSFVEIDKLIQTDRFSEIGFSDSERLAYRSFADSMVSHVTRIEQGARYVGDLDRIQAELDATYRRFMLEQTVPDAALVARCFIAGPYYLSRRGFPVWVVKAFVHLLKSTSPEKRRIIMANLHTRFDSVARYTEGPPDDDIPF